MIYIIITTSIIAKYNTINESHRQNRYIESITQLLQFVKGDEDIKPIIVENNGARDTYLDELECDIVYTNNNEISTTHKGVNELLDIKEVITKYNIKDEDVVIKITGRYRLLNLTFINFVKNNINNYDAFVKFFNVSTLKYMYNDCVLGLFAIKSKYLKDFSYSANYFKSPECEFADYVREHVEKIAELTNIGLECCFAGNLQVLVV